MTLTAATRRLRRDAVLAAMLGALTTPAIAHEVQHEIARAQATVVRLVYADGEPFSYESYELFADGGERPAQTGRTDAQGRVVFLSDGAKSWRLRAFSADGHGVDLKFDAMAVGMPATVTAESDRNTRFLLGLSVILAVFGALQLVLRKKKA